MKIDNDKLVQYLSNILSEHDKKDFENEIKKNDELKSLINDLKHNDEVLKKLNNNFSVSSDFMIKLNKRIDEHEKSNKSWYSIIFNKYPFLSNNKLRSFPQYATFSILLIISFTFYKINDNFTNRMADHSDNDIDLIANVPENDKDSLKIDINEDSQFIYNNNKISK